MDWLGLATLMVGLVLGSGGITALVVDERRRREDKKNYWLQERQRAFAEAMRIHHQLSRMMGWMTNALADENEDEYLKLREKLRLLLGEFEKCRGIIDLIAAKPTQVAAERFARAVNGLVIEEIVTRDWIVVDDIAKGIRAIRAEMWAAFRDELGHDPAEIPDAYRRLLDELYGVPGA